MNVDGCLPTRYQQAKLIDNFCCFLVPSWKVAWCYDTRAGWVFIAMLRKRTTCHDTFAPEYAFAEDHERD